MADFTQHTDHASTSSSSDTMDMSSSSSHSSGSMVMTFHTSTTDPLYSTAWTPSTLGQYVGTIIFIIALGFTYRFLAAYRTVLERKWEKAEKARNVLVAGRPGSQESGIENPKEETEVKKKEDTAAAELWGAKSWRWSVDLPRSGLTVVTTGVGYLLMLAVMTMNVGYFMAVLGGVFLGEMVWGRWTKNGDH